MAIGIFDSGLGGITVYKEFKKKFPNEKVIYFADTANFPYGTKSKEEIIKFSKNIVDFFITLGVNQILIACNTASSYALNDLKKIYNIEILGVIESVSKYMLKEDKSNIVIIATEATIKSKSYNKYLGNLIINSIPAPKLVNYAENKIGVVKDIIKEYFNDIPINSNVILGCTHFPLIENEIKKIFPKLNLINPAIEMVKNIKIMSDIGKDIFYTSSNLEDFKNNLVGLLESENIDVRLHKW